MFKRYPIRVLKYFLSLIVLSVILVALMIVLNWSTWNSFLTVWGTYRVWGLVFVFVGLPLAYPFFGYVGRDVRGSFTERRDAIDRVLAMSGYTVTSETPDRIIAHASGIKKISLLFEDQVTITREGNHYIHLDGPRREVVKMEYRLRTYMNV